MYHGGIQSEASLSLRLLDYEHNPQWHPRIVLDARGRLFPLKFVERLSFRDTPLRGQITIIFERYVLFEEKTVWFQHTFEEPRQLTHPEAVDLLVKHMLNVNRRWKPDGPSIRDFRAGLETCGNFSEMTRLPYAQPP